MAEEPLGLVVRHLCRLADSQSWRDRTDEDLLKRFTGHGDEGAFSALVQRHGCFVLSVCRRILNDHHDAEDGFQATFLVLAQKAGSIRKGRYLVSWLHQVAYHIAVKIRGDSLRRRGLEKEAWEMRSARPKSELPEQQVSVILDEELQRLPLKYRAPVLLCFLEGKTHAEAGRLLGWPLGTVKGRLARARNLLRGRLSRRGLALSLPSLTTLFADSMASATLSPVLAAGTVQAAKMAAEGNLAAMVSPRVIALAQEAINMIFLSKLKTGFLLFFGAILVVCGTVLGNHLRTGPDLPPETNQNKSVAPTVDNRAPVEKKATQVDFHGDPLPLGALARMGNARLRGVVLGFSADSKTLITVGEDYAFHYWEVASQKERKRKQLDFVPTPGRFETVHLVKERSANGRWYVSQDSETIRVWEIGTGREFGKIKTPAFYGSLDHLYRLAVSNDGQRVAASVLSPKTKKRHVYLWDISTGKEHKFTFDLSEFSLPAFSPDGNLLALANNSGTILLYDAKTGKELRKIKCQPVKNYTASPIFSPDGKALIWIDPTQMVKSWDIVDGKPKASFPDLGIGTVYAFKFAGDGKHLAICGDKGIVVIDWTRGTVFRKIPVQYVLPTPFSLFNVAFAPDGKALAITTRGGARIYDLATGKILVNPDGHQGMISGFAFSPDGKILATAGRNDPNIRLWETATGKPLSSLPIPDHNREFLFSPDGKLFLTGDKMGAVRFWDVTTGRETRKMEINESKSEPKYGIVNIATTEKEVIAQGSYYAGMLRSRLVIWDKATGKVRKRVDFPGSFFSWFSKNGTILHLVDYESLCDAPTGKRLVKLSERSYGPLSFSWDSKKVAIGCYKPFAGPRGTSLEMMYAAGVYDIGAGRELCKMNTGPMGILSFSPDGRILAAVGPKDISLWEIATGKRVFQIPAPASFSGASARAFATYVKFSPDGKSLATGLPDTTVLLWDVAPGLPNSGDGKVWSPKTREQFWSDLGGDDAQAAYKTIWTLVSSPDQAIEILKKHLKKASGPDGKIPKLIIDLDSEKFEVRQAAFEKLKSYDIEIEPALRRSLAGGPTEELRRRIDKLLAIPAGIIRNREILRAVRAIQVLETICSPQARALLQNLSEGAPEYRITREAGESLKRLVGK